VERDELADEREILLIASLEKEAETLIAYLQKLQMKAMNGGTAKTCAIHELI